MRLWFAGDDDNVVEPGGTRAHHEVMGERAILSRRGFIAAVLAAVPTRALAIGLPAGPDLYEAITGLPALSEGSGRAVMHVLFSPWCHESPNVHRETRGMLDRLTVRWIPFSGGLTEGRQGTEMLLRNPDPALIPVVLGSGKWVGPVPPTPMSDAQDAAISRFVEPLIARDIGRGLATPTLVYRLGGDRVRVIPGWLDRRQLEELAAEGA